MTTQPVAQQTHRDPAVKLLIALLVGGAVSVALGVYSNVHDPTGEKPYTLFFSDTIHLKVWFATAVVVLAVVQVLLGARLFDKIHVPRHAPPWLGDAHRLVGTVAFALTLPVAYQCLWGLGFESTDTRVLVHSILGCVFYGAIVTKVLAVRMHGLPERTLPLVGGFVFAVLVGIWLTSSFWFFTSRAAGIPLY
jgi:mitochondrial fission protein ELM1